MINKLLKIVIPFSLVVLFFVFVPSALAANRYWVGGGSTNSWTATVPTNWSETSGGGGDASVPTSVDDAFFDANSFSAAGQTVSMVGMTGVDAARNIDWTGTTNNPSWDMRATFVIHGSLTLISGMSISNSSASGPSFVGTVSHTITSAGKTFAVPLTINSSGGTYTLQDALTIGSTRNLTLTLGTLNANNFNVTVNAFSSSNANIRTLTMGSGTWTVNGTGTVWSMATVTNLTLNEDTSTIVASNTTATAKTFAGGGQAFNNITFSGRNITVTGSNTFNTMAVNNAGLADGLLITAGTTQTLTNLTSNGSAGNLTEIKSVTASEHTLTTVSAQISIDYASISYSTVSQANTWYAGANSTDGGNNTNWIFTEPPAAEGASASPNIKVKGGVKVRGGTIFR